MAGRVITVLDTFHADLDVEIAHRLDEWRRAGLLTPEQADRIARAEAIRHAVAEVPDHDRRAEAGAGPSVVEALAYVGAALVAAACAVLVGRLWTDFPTALRAGLLAALAAGGITAGALVRIGADAMTRRLRAVLWSGSAVAAAGSAGVLADAAGWAASDAVLVAGAVGLAVAVAAWSRCASVLLHVITFAAAATTVGAAAAHVDALHDQAAPLGVWFFAVGWVIVGRLWRAVPERTAATLGAVAAVFAAQGTGEVAWGTVLAVATAAAVVALAVYVGELPLLVVGAYAVFMSVPAAMDRLVPGSVGVALGLLIAGLTLLGAAVLTVRRRSGRGAPGR